MNGSAWEEQLEDYRWWDPKLTLDEAFRRAEAVYQNLLAQDQPRRAAYKDYLRLYGNVSDMSDPSRCYRRPSMGSDGRVTFNVVAKWCDFATSRIGKQKPMPVASPRGANYSVSRRARLLSRFFEAQFGISEVYPEARRAFLNATIFGPGVLHPYHDGEQIRIESVLPTELLVDHREATRGKPRQMFRERHVSRDVLRSMFVTDDLDPREKGRRLDIIKRAEASKDTYDTLTGIGDAERHTSDLVRVVEAHRLPSGCETEDGAHAFFVSTGLLHREEYEHEEFPYVIFRWKTHPARFWGTGLAEELVSIQTEINFMLMRAQEVFRKIVKPHVFMSLGSSFVKGSMDNEIGTFARYSGDKPEFWTPQGLTPEFYAHLDRLDRMAGDMTGFAQDAPTGDGARSAVQLSKRHDIETERFSITALGFEDGIQKIGAWFVRLARELDKAGGFQTVAKRDRWSIENVDWKDIDLEDDQYVLSIQNVSQLSTLFSDRVEQVTNLMALGLLNTEQATMLIDLPDLDRFNSMARARSDNLDRIGEMILDDDVYVPPEPTMDIQLGVLKMQDLLNWAQCQGVSEQKLQSIRDWLTEASALVEQQQLEQAKKAAAAAGGLGPQALPAGPGAPPAIGNEGAPPTAVPGT